MAAMLLLVGPSELSLGISNRMNPGNSKFDLRVFPGHFRILLWKCSTVLWTPPNFCRMIPLADWATLGKNLARIGLGERSRGRTATQRSKKGSEMGSGKGSGEGFSERVLRRGSAMGFTQ